MANIRCLFGHQWKWNYSIETKLGRPKDQKDFRWCTRPGCGKEQIVITRIDHHNDLVSSYHPADLATATKYRIDD